MSDSKATVKNVAQKTVLSAIAAGLVASPLVMANMDTAEASPAKTVTQEQMQQDVATIFDDINDYRESLGLKRLKFSTTISTIAQKEATRAATSGDLSHSMDFLTNPAAGQWKSAGEITALSGKADAHRFTKWWKSSAAHNDIMTRSDVDVMGIGLHAITDSRGYFRYVATVDFYGYGSNYSTVDMKDSPVTNAPSTPAPEVTPEPTAPDVVDNLPSNPTTPEAPVGNSSDTSTPVTEVPVDTSVDVAPEAPKEQERPEIVVGDPVVEDDNTVPPPTNDTPVDSSDNSVPVEEAPVDNTPVESAPETETPAEVESPEAPSAPEILSAPVETPSAPTETPEDTDAPPVDGTVVDTPDDTETPSDTVAPDDTVTPVETPDEEKLPFKENSPYRPGSTALTPEQIAEIQNNPNVYAQQDTSIANSTAQPSWVNDVAVSGAIGDFYHQDGAANKYGNTKGAQVDGLYAGGSSQAFENNISILHHASTGAHAVKWNTAIGQYFQANGSEEGVGYPFGNEVNRADSSYQKFRDPVTSVEKTVFSTEATGAHAVDHSSDVGKGWLRYGGEFTVGHPSTDVVVREDGISYQQFKTADGISNIIFSSETTGTYLVTETSPIGQAWLNAGGEYNWGIPVTNSFMAHDGSLHQRFSNGIEVSYTPEAGVQVVSGIN